MNQRRGFPLYLLTGLVIGLAVGLLVAWVIAPVELVDVPPSTLAESFKSEYRALIASAYVANGDLGRAEARLALLGDPNPSRALAAQAQLTLAQGGSEELARALGLLSAVLAGELEPTQGPQPTASLTPSPQETENNPSDAEPTSTSAPTQTSTPTVTATLGTSAQPSRTPTATQGAAFQLQGIEKVCDPLLDPPLIQVYVEDAARNPVPGVEGIVSWEGDEDHFFTGLKPEYGLGYADFSMTPGVIYLLRLVEGAESVTGLTPENCTGENQPDFWGSWQVTFVQP